MLGLRKWSLSLIALLGGIALAWHLQWSAAGYAFVVSMALVPHAAASVMTARSGKIRGTK